MARRLRMVRTRSPRSLRYVPRSLAPGMDLVRSAMLVSSRKYIASWRGVVGWQRRAALPVPIDAAGTRRAHVFCHSVKTRGRATTAARDDALRLCPPYDASLFSADEDHRG